MFKRLLVCSDGSEHALQAARAAAELAKRFDAEVVLLTAFQDLTAAIAQRSVLRLSLDEQAFLRSVTEVLAGAETRTGAIFSQAGIDYRPLREVGHPVDAILNVAEVDKIDLIVMGSRGLTGWQALLLGSVSEGVVHHAHGSVLVVR